MLGLSGNGLTRFLSLMRGHGWNKEFLICNGYRVVDQRTKGVKGAFWEAFEMIKGDVIIPFSPDGNSIPEDIPKLIEKINEGFDMVIASRYLAKQSQRTMISIRVANSPDRADQSAVSHQIYRRDWYV